MTGFVPRVLALLAVAAVAGCSAGADAGRDADRTVRATPSSAQTSPAPTAPASAMTREPSSETGPPRTAPPPPPTRPATRSAAPDPVPPLSPRARAAGLVDVRTVVPDAVIELRYATTDNFTHVRLYPADARCLVHESMTRGLTTAARGLRRLGYLLVFWDCYRPHAVQVRMFRIVPDPNWVARPGPYATSHEAGRSVDVTLARAGRAGTCHTRRVQGHCLLAMGTGFDNFTPRAHAYAMQGVSARAQANRAALRLAMTRGGITVYVGEWWHFDGPGSKVPRLHLRAPLS